MIQRIFYSIIFWRTNIGEVLNKIYDLRIHFKYSFKLKRNRKRKQLEHYIQKQFHVIEKGLALPKPRPGFGKEKIRDIIKKSELYIELYGHNKLLNSVAATLHEYLLFNEKNKEDLTQEFYKNIKNFIQKIEIDTKTGGTKSVNKKDILKAIDIDFENFVKSRNSVRDYSKENVPKKLIVEAIEIAKYAPSVCNRQGWKVHLYENKEHIKGLLNLQNGNRGFTDSINKLIIITGDTTAFTKYEGNQIFVDGGIFAMNLILALHSKGIGSIALNTDIPYVIEKKMKKTGEIPENERLIMYLGIGMLKDQYKVALSNRKNINEILEIHE